MMQAFNLSIQEAEAGGSLCDFEVRVVCKASFSTSSLGKQTHKEMGRGKEREKPRVGLIGLQI